MKDRAGQLSRFLIVGLFAFFLDGVVLSLLVYQFFLPPVSSRMISCCLALLVAFFLHAHFTFRSDADARTLVRYCGLQGVSATLNVLAYSLWLSYGYSYGAPIVGLIIGSVLATICNFLGNKFYVYQDARLNTPTIH